MISLPPATRYVIATKEGDPLLRPARARLIWAANMAQATAALGTPCMLVGGVDAFNYRIESLAGKYSAYRALENLYGVTGEFDITLLQKDSKGQPWTSEGDFKNYVLPNAALVHTRDPRIALSCVKRNIPYIFEHHDEDYQNDFSNWQDLRLDSALCLAVVAITDAVRENLLEKNFPPSKITVLDSGVNAATIARRPEAAGRWRANLLGSQYQKLAVYTGGMQHERGIGDILNSAEKLTDMIFVFAGGHHSDLIEWRRVILQKGLSNVRIFGYQNYETVCELQQAADVLIFSRAAIGRAEITSPLKVFEYLLSGSPIVMADIPVTRRLANLDIAASFYDPSEFDSLTTAIEQTVEKFPHKWEGYTNNMEAGLPFVWEERQRKLLSFVGNFQAKVTY